MKRFRPGRRERGGTLQIVLLILGGLLVLALIAALAALFVIRRFVRVDVDTKAGRPRVEISTPVASMAIEKPEDVARKFNLPVYPRARATDQSVSVKMQGELEGQRGMLEVTAAEFFTDDDLEQVDAWYRRQLGPEFKRQQGHLRGSESPREHGDWHIHVDPGGRDVLFSDEREGHLRGVALERKLGRVRIGMFDVAQAGPQ